MWGRGREGPRRPRPGAQGSEPVDVLKVTRGARFSGEAFVVLAGPAQQDFAMTRNRTYLGAHRPLLPQTV